MTTNQVKLHLPTFTFTHLSHTVSRSDLPGWRQRGSHSSEPSTSLIFAPGQAITPNLSSQARLHPVCPILQLKPHVNSLYFAAQGQSICVRYSTTPIPLCYNRAPAHAGSWMSVATRHIACFYSYSGAQPADMGTEIRMDVWGYYSAAPEWYKQTRQNGECPKKSGMSGVKWWVWVGNSHWLQDVLLSLMPMIITVQ